MKHWLLLAGLAVMVVAPFAHPPVYFFHLTILVLIWAVIGTAWSYMGRFGLVSLGHGGFVAVGVYATALLWNRFGLTPWLGIPVGLGLSLVLALLIGYPSFRFRVVGHYFALVTLALGEVVRLSIIAGRGVTGAK